MNTYLECPFSLLKKIQMPLNFRTMWILIWDALSHCWKRYKRNCAVIYFDVSDLAPYAGRFIKTSLKSNEIYQWIWHFILEQYEYFSGMSFRIAGKDTNAFALLYVFAGQTKFMLFKTKSFSLSLTAGFGKELWNDIQYNTTVPEKLKKQFESKSSE